jgi:acetyl-CoA synthetase
MSTSLKNFLSARDFLLAHREDYRTAYRDFHRPELDYFNWALDYFDSMAKGNTQTALWIVEEDDREAKYSFEWLSARSNQVANFLRHHGVQRSDRVIMMLNNQIALWETMLACIKLGAVMIPATPLLNREELTDRVERGRVSHVVIRSEDSAKFDGVTGAYTRFAVGEPAPGWIDFEDAYKFSSEFTPDGPTRADETLLLYFTSGTTSRPKLVEHTHQSYPVGHLSTMYWIGIRPGDIHLNISSPGWAKHAWSSFFAPWNAGATIFTYNYDRFDPRKVLNTIVRCGVTTLCAPPTVWRMLIQKDLKSYPVKLRELVGAGEPLNPEIIEKVEHAWGLTLRDGFGQTETTCLIGNSPGQPLKLGSMGRPMPGYQVVLLDPDGNESSEGEISLRLQPRPLGLMVGYRDDPEKTAAVMSGGYYRTGDVAALGEEGYITYVGRADDVFKASDYRISPFELESVLMEHQAVAEAAVVPSPDPLRLAVPKAFVVLVEGVQAGSETAEDILRFCRANLSPFKRIRRLEFKELPKTISGKIRRVELRRMELERDTKERRDGEFWEEDFPDLKK